MEASTALCLVWGSAQLSVARARLPFAQLCFANIKISLDIVQCRFLPKPGTTV